MNNKLRVARIRKCWSERDVFDVIGVDKRTYQRWERGQLPQPLYRKKLCELFEMSLEELGLLPPDMPVILVSEPVHEETRQEKSLSVLAMPEQQPLLVTSQSISETLNVFELGMSLIQLAGLVNGWSQSEFQWRTQQALGDMMKLEPGMISRRQAISFLIGTSGAVLIPGSLPANEVLPFCSNNIATCWQLGKGAREEMFLAKAAVTSYLPTLTSLAQQPSVHQPIAADLAAQCYRLKAILGYHTESLAAAEENAKAAVSYSRISGEPNLLVTSLVLQALIYYYSDRPEKALEKCQEAYLYKDQITFATQSYLYRMQAVCQAQLDQEKEALTTLELAKLSFSRHPINEVPFMHAAHDQFEMDLWEGITLSHLGSHSTAVKVLEKVDPLNAHMMLPERVRTGFLNNLVFAQLRIPASKRSMEKSIALWKASIRGAIDLKSELRFGEAYRAYQEMLVAFPGEQEIKRLRGSLQRWKQDA
jgi:transcriptional regulator with XRE-family HTH domain/tetratricopeptide (TPR) repeat protein